MKPLRILILEDEPLVAMDLESVVATAARTDVRCTATIAAARRVVAGRIDFALLDIDVRDGKSFDLARELDEDGTPFAFVSASRLEDVPEELRHAAFISKPYRPEEIERVILERASLTQTSRASNDNGKG